MADIIIIGVLLIAVFFGARATLKHFKGEGACCGGATYKPTARKLDKVVACKTFVIDGMNCQNCENRVHEAINSIEGVSAVVSYKKGTAIVSMDHIVEDSLIKAAIEKRGYMVREIR